MNDLISRQAAIEAVKKNTFRLTFAEEQNCGGHVAWSAEAVYSDVMEGALLELPSAQPERTQERTETHACDLIDRQAAIETLFDWEMTYDWDEHCREEDPKPAYIVSPSDVIEQLPSAQPEITRCKDCEHWTNDDCPFAWGKVEDAFCSYAERRTDG